MHPWELKYIHPVACGTWQVILKQQSHFLQCPQSLSDELFVVVWAEPCEAARLRGCEATCVALADHLYARHDVSAISPVVLTWQSCLITSFWRVFCPFCCTRALSFFFFTAKNGSGNTETKQWSDMIAKPRQAIVVWHRLKRGDWTNKGRTHRQRYAKKIWNKYYPDWLSRYQVSPARTNFLRPSKIRAGCVQFPGFSCGERRRLRS